MGKGKKVNSDGSSYEGEYKNNMPDGTGSGTWADGDSYQG